MNGTIRSLQTTSHDIAVEHGFWEDRKTIPFTQLIATKLMLIVSEAAEALESLRESEQGTIRTWLSYPNGRDSVGKPEGFASELADIVIRVADLAEYLGIDLETVIAQKEAFNRTRPYMHGKTV